MAAPKKRKPRQKVSWAVVHIGARFNDTVVTINDPEGDALCRASSGTVGFKGSRKSTPFATQRAAETAAAVAAAKFGTKQVGVVVSGPRSGRESAISALRASGLSIKTIKETTLFPRRKVKVSLQPVKVQYHPLVGTISREQAKEAVRVVMEKKRGKA